MPPDTPKKGSPFQILHCMQKIQHLKHSETRCIFKCVSYVLYPRFVAKSRWQKRSKSFRCEVREAKSCARKSPLKAAVNAIKLAAAFFSGWALLLEICAQEATAAQVLKALCAQERFSFSRTFWPHKLRFGYKCSQFPKPGFKSFYWWSWPWFSKWPRGYQFGAKNYLWSKGWSCDSFYQCGGDVPERLEINDMRFFIVLQPTEWKESISRHLALKSEKSWWGNKFLTFVVKKKSCWQMPRLRMTLLRRYAKARKEAVVGRLFFWYDVMRLIL